MNRRPEDAKHPVTLINLKIYLWYSSFSVECSRKSIAGHQKESFSLLRVTFSLSMPLFLSFLLITKASQRRCKWSSVWLLQWLYLENKQLRAGSFGVGLKIWYKQWRAWLGWLTTTLRINSKYQCTRAISGRHQMISQRAFIPFMLLSLKAIAKKTSLSQVSEIQMLSDFVQQM